MAVIINELEVVLEPTTPPPAPGTTTGVPKAAQIGPHDILTLLDRELGNSLRVLAH